MRAWRVVHKGAPACIFKNLYFSFHRVLCARMRVCNHEDGYKKGYRASYCTGLLVRTLYKMLRM